MCAMERREEEFTALIKAKQDIYEGCVKRETGDIAHHVVRRRDICMDCDLLQIT